jgi:hypothetical protein
MFNVIFVTLVASVATLGQAPAAPPPKPMGDPLSAFVGQWSGVCDGEPGHGTTDRTYEYTLRGKYLLATSRTVFPPQPKNPKGETHEDVGYFSYDRSRKLLVLRQFHVEGFVNQYAEEPRGSSVANDRPGAPVGALAFVSESLENTPTGWRARERYAFESPDAFTETFELAEPGRDFVVYTQTRFARKK